MELEPITHLEKSIAGTVAPVTHLEKVIEQYGGGGGGGAVSSVNGKTGAVVLSASDVGAAAAGAVYTKEEIEQKLVGAMTYRGTKAAVSDLPVTGNTIGDVWHITVDGSEWAWDGSEWQNLGTVVDISGKDGNKTYICTNFDSAETYAVGDYVMYSSALYECTTAHTGAWNASHFTAVTLNEGDLICNTDENSSVAWSDITGKPTIPTAVSQLTNDSGYQTAAQVTAAINSALGVIENGSY